MPRKTNTTEGSRKTAPVRASKPTESKPAAVKGPSPAAEPVAQLSAVRQRRHADKTLIEQLHEALTARNEADAEYERLASQVREEYPASDKPYEENGVVLRVTPNLLFNKTKAKELYGTAVCSQQVDINTARKVLTGEQMEALYEVSTGKPTKVVVELAKDK